MKISSHTICNCRDNDIYFCYFTWPIRLLFLLCEKLRLRLKRYDRALVKKYTKIQTHKWEVKLKASGQK